jgi:hypothetical protein
MKKQHVVQRKTMPYFDAFSWRLLVHSKELVADGRILREVILRDAPGKLKFIAGFCPLFSRKSLDWFKGHVTGKP